MNITSEHIQRYDKIVRNSFPTSKMQKIDNQRLIWTDNYRIVASVDVRTGKVIFKFETT